MSKYDKEVIIKELLPLDKQSFSRDAVEILMSVAIDKAIKKELKDIAEKQRCEKHGDNI